MEERLQPYAVEAAAVSRGGYSRTQLWRRPHAVEATAVCSRGERCSRGRSRIQQSLPPYLGRLQPVHAAVGSLVAQRRRLRHESLHLLGALPREL